jgi:hypothetical protein
MRQEDFDWFSRPENLQVWWSNRARWVMGRVAAGLPGIESDENGEPTGWVRFAHPDIDEWDQLILDICLAGKAYVEQMGMPELVRMQAEKDLVAFQTLMASDLSHEDKIRAIKLNVIKQATALKVPVPELDADLNFVPQLEVVEEPVVKPPKPDTDDLKALWVEYAVAYGYDTTGLTKAEIIALVK